MKYHTIWSQSKCPGPIILFYFGILTLGTTPLTVTHKYRRSFFLDGLEKKMKISPSIFSLSNMRLWSTLIFYWNDKTSIKIKLTKQENRWWLDWETSPGLITVVWKTVPSNTEWTQWTFPSSENMESKTN